MTTKRKGFSLKARAINSSEETPAVAPVIAEPAAPAKPAAEELTKRLTLDMPLSLHTQLKIKSMEEGITMAKMVRRWIEEKMG